MSYTDFDFPHTHMYDSDLRELIAMYKKVLDDYNELVNSIRALNEWKVQHEAEYAALLVNMQKLQNDMTAFEAKINNDFSTLEAALRVEFNNLKADVNAELRAALQEFTRLYNQLKTEVQSEIDSMKVEINNLLTYLYDQIASINQNVIGYVNDRLDEFIAHLPDYENLIVNNPVTGTQTNVQQAINDLYLMFLVYGITAEQYDSLQLTASEFDAKNLAAKEYDSLAYNLLDYPDPNYYMRDPFNGHFEKNKVVIQKLADLHRLALTASEYDALEIPAETFDGLQLTAYYFDWYGINIGTSAINASDYDAMQIEAIPYDNKRIGAYDYDNYAQLILSTL